MRWAEQLTGTIHEVGWTAGQLTGTVHEVGMALDRDGTGVQGLGSWQGRYIRWSGQLTVTVHEVGTAADRDGTEVGVGS